MTSAKTTIKQMHAAQQSMYRANFALGEKIDALEAEVEALRGALGKVIEELHFMARVSEMSAGIMRDPHRTGKWAGAEKTANAFDRIGLRAARAKASARTALGETLPDELEGVK